jgi:Asp-tRNA(Asn)/Glu-tRNA(Gln) amidotransferase A subunit family amidase
VNPPQPHELDAVAAVEQIRRGDLTPIDLVEDCAAQVHRWEPQVHAWVSVNESMVRRNALRLVGDLNRYAMPGIPIGVKDIFNTFDFPTEMGSPIWKGFTPGNDARVVAAARQEGGIVFGKTATAEFAVHTPGPTRHPLDEARSPGTSSSGSAVAVATGMVPVAFGTQTAGSIIRPASYCGVVGFKPSFGLVPRTGVLKTTDTLDSIGWLTRSVRDARLLLDVTRVVGSDYPLTERQISQHEIGHQEPCRIAVIRGPKWGDAEPYAQDALLIAAAALSKLDGLEVVEPHELPDLSQVHETHQTLYERFLAYYFRGEYLARTLVSPLLNSMILRGLETPLADFEAALARQSKLRDLVDTWMVKQRLDALVTLSTGGEAPLHHEPDRPDSCLIWTLCGMPAISAPAFRGPNRLPFGLQLVGRRFSDYRLLSLAARVSAEFVGCVYDASGERASIVV